MAATGLGLAAGEAAGFAAADGDAAIEGDAAMAGEAAADGAAAVVGFAGAAVGAAAGAAGDGWQAARAGIINTTAAASAATSPDGARRDIASRAPRVSVGMIQIDFRLAPKRATVANLPFLDRLRAAVRRNQSLLCVGLDPSPELLPTVFAGQPPDAWMVPFVRGIVDATADLACCFKPNIAFYEAAGMAGQIALREILKALPADVPVLLDAKRGDIGSTTDAYARAIFEDLRVDAVTVSPYLGGDALAPFFAFPDKGVFVLCKTSNAGSGELQDELLANGEPVYQHIARRALSWDRHGTLGLVVGATYPDQLAAVRGMAPEVPILVPGVGAQAGDLAEAVVAGLDARGEGILVNASRSILYASRDSDWQAAARAEAERLRDAINGARASAATVAP